MLSLSLPGRVFLCLLPTDMRKSFDTLACLVQEQLDQDPTYSCEERWTNTPTSTSGRQSSTPREKVGACARPVRVPTFGDSYFAHTAVVAAVSSGSSRPQETRKTMREEFVRQSMTVPTPEARAREQ